MNPENPVNPVYLSPRLCGSMVAVRKNPDLVWVWFYKEVAPTALFKGANPAK
jgi:hypothetical protein